MKGFLKKAKADLQERLNSDHDTSRPPQAQQQNHLSGGQSIKSSTLQELTAVDILRYRYHHGTNLGSAYVLEKWLTPSRFPEGASGTSELECVKSWVSKIGIDATRAKFEEAWANALSEADISWLENDAKCSTIRLPIGYYCLDPSLSKGTPFEKYSGAYANAWSSITSLISRLRSHSIGVLLDLHALPGGANGGEHSGTNSKRAELWDSHSNRKLGVKCCEFLAREVRTKGLDVVGIQIINEADWESKDMYEWYDDCITAVSAIDRTTPVVISDAWNLDKAVDYCLKKNTVYPSQPTCPVLIDTHYYWVFSAENQKMSPQQIIEDVGKKMGPLNGKEGDVLGRGAVQVIVGEYSCVLSEQSWSKSGGALKEELVKQFGQAQSKKYQQRAGGSFFWNYKMDWMPGGEWGFKAQTQNGAITPPPVPQGSVTELVERAHRERDGKMRQAVDQHVSYWNRTTPSGHFEHDKYEAGWKTGYQDALAFFQGRPQEGVKGSNKIGNLELWVLKKIRESEFRGKFVWEFEQGLRRGMGDFYNVVGWH